MREIASALKATMALFSVVYHGNEWFSGIISVADPHELPVRAFPDRTLKTAAAQIRADSRGADVAYKVPPTLTIKKVLVAFPFFQRYFVEGILISSIV